MYTGFSYSSAGTEYTRNAGDVQFNPRLGRSPEQQTGYPLQSVFLGFPGGSDSEESAYNAGDLDLIPGLGRSSGEGHDNPLQYSCLDNPRGPRSLEGYSPWGHKELDMTEQLRTAHHMCGYAAGSLDNFKYFWPASCQVWLLGWLQILFCNGTNKEFKTRVEISVLAMLFIHKDIINIILKEGFFKPLSFF